MSWYDDPQSGEEDDIINIVVVGKKTGGGGTGGDIGTSVKMAAAQAQWVLQRGGEILVVIGGVAMVVGGVSAWTGGGAGAFVAGSRAFGIGAAAYWVGSLLEEIVRDPPQPLYKRPVRLIPASMGLDLAGEAGSPMDRMAHHFSHLCVLAPNMLDAMERQGGAVQAQDDDWAARWADTMSSLHGLMLARYQGLANALQDLADLNLPSHTISREQMAEGLKLLQSAKGRKEVEDALLGQGFQPELTKAALDWAARAKATDIAQPANTANVLSAMGKKLAAGSAVGLAQF